MNPLKTVNLIIYYGALIHKSDYEMLVKHLNMQQLYTTISQTGLTFKDVGKIGSSWDYVVGKELKCEFEKLKKNWGEKYQRLEDKYTKLKYKYENQKMMIPQRDNQKIDKCISNINNVIATLNIK